MNAAHGLTASTSQESELQLFGWRTGQSQLDVLLLLTLVVVMVSPAPHDPWYLRVAAIVLSIGALVFRPLLRHVGFWGIMAVLHIVVFNFVGWEFSDNHKFLLSYWCLAIAGALCLQDPAAALATTSRLLIGLVFLFATVWKATSIVYLSDTNFHFLLLTDFRFFPLANLLAGVSPEVFEANRDALAGMNTLQSPITLQATDGVAALATFLTRWTVILEGLIALLFLIPKGRVVTVVRHVTLLGFVVVTYPPTNVIQFGWIIVVMGLASSPVEFRRIRSAYFAALIFIFCFSTGAIRNAFYEWVVG